LEYLNEVIEELHLIGKWVGLNEKSNDTKVELEIVTVNNMNAVINLKYTMGELRIT